MKKNKRQEQILGMVALNGEVSVDTLAEKFGVSVMTIRRDLACLSRAGLLNRMHGGAVSSRAGVIEFSFRERGERNAAQKRAIAHVVADMITPVTTVLLDTGTTTLEVARAIKNTGPLTVLTTSLAIASVLHSSDSIEVVLLGGTVRKNNPDLAGGITEENLKRFRVHLAVLGADAVTPDGVFTTDEGISRISRAMADNSEAVVLAVDSSKFMQTAFMKAVPLDKVDKIVTDDGCLRDVRGWLEKKVTEVIYAKVGGA